jgi:hypothetical protein
VRSQELDAGEVDGALLEHVEEDREPAGHAAGLDPVQASHSDRCRTFKQYLYRRG